MGVGTWSNHCNATDKEHTWVQRRHQKSSNTSSSNPTSNHSRFSATTRLPRWMEQALAERGRPYAYLGGNGPWAPDHAVASTVTYLAKCRKCGWLSRLVGGNKWCLKCGRIAQDEALSSLEQSVVYKSKKDDIFLGTREISFRLVSRDPRLIEKYRESWSAADTSTAAWTYDAAEMEEEVFRSRLGKHPRINDLLTLLLNVREEKLKEWMSNDKMKEKGLEAMILDNPCDAALLKALHISTKLGEEPLPYENGEYPCGDISAVWHKAERKGVSHIIVNHNEIISRALTTTSGSSLFRHSKFESFFQRNISPTRSTGISISRFSWGAGSKCFPWVLAI